MATTPPPSPTNDPSTANGAGTEAARLSSEMFRAWEKAMGAWWDQVLEAPAFLGAVNQNLAQGARARGAWTHAVDEAMERAHLPSRGDVVRMLRVATLLEDRLLAQEDTLLELRDRLAAAEREALQARVEAAEARLEARAQLDTILARLDAMQHTPASEAPAPDAAGAAAAPPEPSPRRGRR